MLATVSNTLLNWAVLISSLVVVAGSCLAVLRWGVRHTVKDELAPVTKQVTPNGGNTDTIGDRSVRIEAHTEHIVGMVTEMGHHLERLQHTIDTHLGWHQGFQDGQHHPQEEEA